MRVSGAEWRQEVGAHGWREREQLIPAGLPVYHTGVDLRVAARSGLLRW